jgi:hypothetical protein
MSSRPEPPVPAYDAAEKGTLEITAPAPALLEVKDEKKLIKEKEALPTLAKAAPKPPKKKVSKWILWQLWFNTYR